MADTSMGNDPQNYHSFTTRKIDPKPNQIVAFGPDWPEKAFPVLEEWDLRHICIKTDTLNRKRCTIASCLKTRKNWIWSTIENKWVQF